MALYFTSDLHLGHKNIITHCHRPFLDVDDMNYKIIENINATVDIGDELWVLGDFAYGINQEALNKLRRKIVCKHVHLIYGNHDKNYDQSNIFQSVQYYKELKTKYGRMILFHYPISDWRARHYGSIHLHGHIHSTGEYNIRNLKGENEGCLFEGHHLSDNNTAALRIYDVGVDANDYKPVGLEQIAAWMNLP